MSEAKGTPSTPKEKEITDFTTLPTVTTSISNNITKVKPITAASSAHDDGQGTAVTVVVVIIILVLSLAIIVFAFRFLKKRGKLNNIPCWKPMTRSRKTSISSSRRALAEQDEIEATVRSKKSRGQTDDMFTIEDVEDANDPQEGKEEYFYDEVFAKSQFEDETTNNAMRQLYSEQDLQEEVLDMDFETLGIKLDGYDLDRNVNDKA